MAGQGRRREFPEAGPARGGGAGARERPDDHGGRAGLGLDEAPRPALGPALRRAWVGARATVLDGGLVRPVPWWPRTRGFGQSATSGVMTALVIALEPMADDASLFGAATR